jgi:2Fe-2S ferredoxin
MSTGSFNFVLCLGRDEGILRVHMAGKNPYLSHQEVPKPTQAYRLEIPACGKTIEVDPAKVPYSGTGLEGSLLEIALAHGVEIDHACGGVLACSTCHVWVKEGLNSCNEASDEELDQLDSAPGVGFQSRLACQCVPSGASKIVIEIPSWNRNLAREGKHE